MEVIYCSSCDAVLPDVACKYTERGEPRLRCPFCGSRNLSPMREFVNKLLRKARQRVKELIGTWRVLRESRTTACNVLRRMIECERSGVYVNAEKLRELIGDIEKLRSLLSNVIELAKWAVNVIKLARRMSALKTIVGYLKEVVKAFDNIEAINNSSRQIAESVVSVSRYVEILERLREEVRGLELHPSERVVSVLKFREASIMFTTRSVIVRRDRKVIRIPYDQLTVRRGRMKRIIIAGNGIKVKIKTDNPDELIEKISKHYQEAARLLVGHEDPPQTLFEEPEDGGTEILRELVREMRELERIVMERLESEVKRLVETKRRVERREASRALMLAG